MKPTTLGQLVKLDPPRPALSNMTVGRIVPYRGKHSPRKPRVRWASGWATTCQAADLAELPPAEAATAPPIPEVDIDRPEYWAAQDQAIADLLGHAPSH